MSVTDHQQAHRLRSEPKSAVSTRTSWPPMTAWRRRCWRRWRTTGCWCSTDLDQDPQAQVAFCERLGEIDRSADGHHPVPGIYPITLGQDRRTPGGRISARRPSTGISTVARRRPMNARRRPRCCRRSRSPPAAGRPSSRTPMPPTRRSATAEKERVRLVACRAFAGGLAAPGLSRSHRPSSWRGGSRAPPTRIRWSGRTAAAADRWCSARRRTTSSGMDLDEGRALLAELLDARHDARQGVQPQVVGGGHGDLGQPAACCTGPRRTSRTHPERCCAPRCSGMNPSFRRVRVRRERRARPGGPVLVGADVVGWRGARW